MAVITCNNTAGRPVVVAAGKNHSQACSFCVRARSMVLVVAVFLPAAPPPVVIPLVPVPSRVRVELLLFAGGLTVATPG